MSGKTARHIDLLILYQIEQAAAIELGDESKLTKMVALKPLDKQISEHKDINKVIIQLSTIISSLKNDAAKILKSFSKFSNIWNQVSYLLNTLYHFIENLFFY